MTTVDGRQFDGIRQATQADLYDVFRIEQAAFSQPWSMESFEQFLGEPGFLVATAAGPGASVGGDVVGYIVATGVRVGGRPMGHVKDLAVAPDRQGEGIGSSLLDRGLSVLAGLGYDRARLEVRESNERAKSLYRRFGFRVAGSISAYYPDGEDALLLIASLTDRE